MLTKIITRCHNIHELYTAVSDLQPVGNLEGRDVRLISTDASDTIPISLIADKFLELTALKQNPTHEEQVDHQKTLSKIKSLNEGVFTELQRRYVEQNLQAYLSDPSATGSKPEAVKRIRQAFDTKCITIDLNGLNLNKLPDTLGQLAQLKSLYLNGNRLTSLPEALGQLAQLQYLNLSWNKLTSLPATLGQLAQLQYLNLAENQLTSLPAALGQLTQLQALYLTENQLTSLPAALGQLAQLQTLYLVGNSNLRELPLTLGSIPGLTFIDTEGTALDRQLVADILRQCAAVRRAQGQIVLPQRLQTWKTAGNSQVDLSDIERFTDDDKDILNEWLVRLERTNDFRGNQQPLAQTVCEMFRSMTQNEELKGIFLTFMEANNEINACEDRTAQALNELYTAWKLWQLPKDAPLSERLSTMIRAANTHALRAAITECIKQEEQKNGHPALEAVEIQLFYELEIGKRIPLLSAIREMRHSPIGKKDWIKVDNLIKTVKDTYIDHLIELPSFAKVLADDKKFQDVWAPHEKAFADHMDVLDDLARKEGVSKHISEQQYLFDSEKMMKARKHKYKECVEQWLASFGMS